MDEKTGLDQVVCEILSLCCFPSNRARCRPRAAQERPKLRSPLHTSRLFSPFDRQTDKGTPNSSDEAIPVWHNVEYHRAGMSNPDPIEELRRLYPPILTTAHVAKMMHSTIGDVRDKVHRRELKAMRWGQQFRFFRDEVLGTLQPVDDDTDDDDDE